MEDDMWDVLFWLVVLVLGLAGGIFLLVVGIATEQEEGDAAVISFVISAALLAVFTKSVYQSGATTVPTEGFFAGYLERGKIYVTEAVAVNAEERDESYAAFIRLENNNELLSYRFSSKPPPCFMVKDTEEGLSFQQVDCTE